MLSIIDTNLDLLKVFYRVAKNGSMTSAARDLFVTQPAVSRSVQLLEHRLNCQLFERSARRIKLTQEGRILFEKVGAAFELLNAGQKQIENLRGLSSGVIDIGATHVVMRCFLMQYLVKFHENYPNIRLRMHTQNMRELTAMQENEETDLAVVATPTLSTELFGSSIEAIPLTTYRYMFIASREHYKQLTHKKLHLEEINQHPLIVLRPGTQTRDYLEARFSEKSQKLNVLFECDMMSMVVDFTRHGFGIGAVISPVLEQSQNWGMDLIEVPLHEKFPPGRMVLIRKKNKELSPAAEAFLHFLKKECQP